MDAYQAISSEYRPQKAPQPAPAADWTAGRKSLEEWAAQSSAPDWRDQDRLKARDAASRVWNRHKTSLLDCRAAEQQLQDLHDVALSELEDVEQRAKKTFAAASRAVDASTRHYQEVVARQHQHKQTCAGDRDACRTAEHLLQDWHDAALLKLEEDTQNATKAVAAADRAVDALTQRYHKVVARQNQQKQTCDALVAAGDRHADTEAGLVRQAALRTMEQRKRDSGIRGGGRRRRRTRSRSRGGRRPRRRSRRL